MNLKSFAILISAIFLISCGSSDATSSTKSFSNSEYTISIPSSWQELDSNGILSKSEASSFKIFQAGYTLGGVYPKLTISKEKVFAATDSLQYAKDNITKGPLVATQYTKIEERDVSINKIATKIHIFQALPAAGVPQMTFIQTYLVLDRYTAYTITVSTSPSEKNYEKYIGLLTSFSFKSN